MGVLACEEDNFSIKEIDKYISGWHYLIYGSNLGCAIVFNESDLKIYSHYLRVLDYLKIKLEKILLPEHIQDLKSFVEQIKEVDTKSNNKLVVNVDQFLSRVLFNYRLVINSTKVYVRNAFLACDLDGNGSINLNEFLTLFRHIEVHKFSLSKAFKIFEQNADNITEHEKSLSFSKFTAISLQNHLFLDSSQRSFIGITDNSSKIQPLFTQLSLDWLAEKQIILN